jgi:Trypsin-like peptidase domain
MESQMTTVLDAPQYPWHSPAARQLYELMMQQFPQPQAALLYAKRSQVDTSWILEAQPIAGLWKDILEKASTANRLRALVQDVHDVLLPDNAARPFLGELLADREPRSSLQPEGGFDHADDSVSEDEARLFRDDLTLPIGRVPALVATLQTLLTLAPAVCKLTVDFPGEGRFGTGFRVGPDLLLTNWHVVHADDGTEATAVTAEFGFEDDGGGGTLASRGIRCVVPAVASDRPADWAVLRAADPLDPAWPVIDLEGAAEPTTSTSAFVVQHPLGQRKKLGFVRNQVSYVDKQVVHYLTDTDVGSSGSPVFDDHGMLIALHHRGGRPQTVLGKPPLRKNEGIAIARVFAGIHDAGLL